MYYLNFHTFSIYLIPVIVIKILLKTYIRKGYRVRFLLFDQGLNFVPVGQVSVHQLGNVRLHAQQCAVRLKYYNPIC